MSKLIVFDCDSTLSEIEGVDELARAKGEEVFQKCVQLTNDAMGGIVPIADVFAKRLDLIQPSKSLCEEVGEQYIEQVEPTALSLIEKLKADDWNIVILSGGFAEVIKPFADFLGLTHIEAVPLYFNEDGSYKGYGQDYPTTRNGGKPDIIKELIKSYKATTTIMVGDGVSDLETQGVASLFIGYGGLVERASVKDKAEQYVYKLEDILNYI